MDCWSNIRWLAGHEIKQKEEEGCDVRELREKYNKLVLKNASDDAFEKFYDRLEKLSVPDRYDEPSDLKSIIKKRRKGKETYKKKFPGEELFDKIYGAWLGRSAGCLLGKPVEGYSKEQIRLAAELSNAGWPITKYFGEIKSPPAQLKNKNWDSKTNRCLRESINGMERDDDMDYTIAGLRVMEKKGLNFTTEDIGRYWLEQLPYYQIFTAERAAYRNLVNGIRPPKTATYRNPAREWIGAQIRADIFGYVCPGMPEKAAEFAFRDASLSHTKNGIYGEMMIAAMISAGFVTDDIGKIIDAGLALIPEDSRIFEAVHNVVTWRKEDMDWEKTADRIADEYGKLQGCHVITNAAIVILGLLYGGLDFEKAIAFSVMSGFDTDCNSATVGSILGTILGAKALPGKWIEPLNDSLKSIIVEMPEVKISDLARRTRNMAFISRRPHR